MAMNSTPPTPASIMRLMALHPPPPTPTTRITARYGLSEERAGASMRSSPASAGGGRSTASAAARSAFAEISDTVSVDLKSWANGPSRMLCRFAIAQHLHCKITVRLGGVAL